MSKAGSALMGIGRASGENRAVAAAEQAIESPLLEVSIDGARGILFNVIGGNDLAMHEINAAAEAITAAADPEANIIFGATINPDLDGEVIITVVATGFDQSYYAKKTGAPAAAAPKEPVLATVTTSKQDEKALAEIDMDLGDDDKPADFHEDTPMPNIWALHDEDEASEDKKAEKQPAEDKDNAARDDEARRDDHHDDHPGVISSSLEEDLEKPSFLRRLGRRRGKDSGDDSDDEPTGE
jgi:cell division protein FtsZ